MKPAALNSAMMRLTDECLVPLRTHKEMEKIGSDEIAIREPDYVFAVSNLLNSHIDRRNKRICLLI
ncbi:hypothetical protein CWB96_13480 [Pseudoalteromonas citrea]|uniref:Uncharacterized protein n=1 Tax=Pseudoalteromonas citrea TaxID=43655 RepID=A0A5S3XNP1_9GAMM|nr:hypothetical protein CWB96_13480 [Pseudoalteromonas citrea]